MAFRSIYACGRLLMANSVLLPRASPSSRVIPTNLVSQLRQISVSAVNLEGKVARKRKSPPRNVEYNRAVSEAERLVNQGSSASNMRYLLNEEVGGVAMQLRKIIASDHPLIQTSKSLLYNEKTTMQSWALFILLVSKAAGYPEKIPDNAEMDPISGILSNQRLLSEIVELTRITFFVHQSLYNLQPLIADGEDMKESADDIFGNKIALLSGDYLLSMASTSLSSLRNQSVSENISFAIRDMSESEFVGDHDDQNNPLPARPKAGSPDAEVEDDFDFDMVFQKLDVAGALGNAEREWTVRNLLSTGSLLARACQSSMVLAGNSKEMQQKAYHFGKHLALAWAASTDLQPFAHETIPENATFDLASAPVLYHLNAFPETYAEIEKGKKFVQEVDFVKLHSDIKKGPGIEKTRQLQRKHVISALKVLDEFPNTQAKVAMQNIILAMQDLS